MAAILVPAWTGRMDQQQLVATNEDLADLHGALVGQALDEDVDQQVFVVVVEHVSEAVRCHSNHAGQDAILAVRHKLDPWVARTMLLGGFSTGSAEALERPKTTRRRCPRLSITGRSSGRPRPMYSHP